MKKDIVIKPNYGNWVPGKMIVLPAILAAICFCLISLSWVFILLGAAFLVTAAYFLAARYLFSPRGGNIQDRIQELIFPLMEWSGEGSLLDIGCGNGALTIKAAKHFPHAAITGVDFWGRNWDYSQQVCETNARIEHVQDMVAFQKASASHLPFQDDCFNAVISNLVFHEVKNLSDKREAVREALRVLKPGGVFVFQDLFLIEQYYGKPEELIAAVHTWGVQKVEFLNTSRQAFIPGLLKLPFMVGTISIMYGIK